MLHHVGTVVRGRQLGRTIGFPTANLLLDGDDVDVPNGVYAAWLVRDGDTRLPGAASIGVRPTVEAAGERTLEVHVLDQQDWLDLYGERVAVELVELLREERRFDGLDELTAQIERDCDAARQVLRRVTA